MKIGIIGAGAIGGLLAAKWVERGHSVSLANSRGPASLAELAAKTGARAVTVEDAVRDVDLVVVSIPQKSVPLLPKDLFRGVPDQVIVVDTGNYYPSFRDGEIAALEGGLTESGWVAQQLGRPVLKVFNSIMAHSLAEGGLPAGTPGRIALPIAGDDARAKGSSRPSSTRSASTESTQAAWTSPGGSSPAHLRTAPTTTPPASGALWPRPIALVFRRRASDRSRRCKAARRDDAGRLRTHGPRAPGRPDALTDSEHAATRAARAQELTQA